MTQEEKLDILISYLMNEQPLKRIQGSQRYIQSKFDIFAALLSQREAKAVPKKILSLQDDFLKTKIRESGIITIDQTEQISDRFFLYKGNLHQLEVDAIVTEVSQTEAKPKPNTLNTTNSKIHTYAGMQLRQENKITAKDFINNQAPKITTAYNLPSQNIIHISLNFSVMQSKEESLENCYKACLNLAKEKGIKSIAFPNIATTSKVFTQQQAAKIAIKASKDFANQNKEMKIIYALNNSGEYNIYESELREKVKKIEKNY